MLSNLRKNLNSNRAKLILIATLSGVVGMTSSASAAQVDNDIPNYSGVQQEMSVDTNSISVNSPPEKIKNYLLKNDPNLLKKIDQNVENNMKDYYSTNKDFENAFVNYKVRTMDPDKKEKLKKQIEKEYSNLDKSEQEKISINDYRNNYVKSKIPNFEKGVKNYKNDLKEEFKNNQLKMASIKYDNDFMSNNENGVYLPFDEGYEDNKNDSDKVIIPGIDTRPGM